MKKLLPLVLILCVLLTACQSNLSMDSSDSTSKETSSGINSQTPIQKNVSSDTEEVSAKENIYDESMNFYNANTAVTDEYIFIVENWSIYRMNRKDASIVKILSNSEDEPRIIGGPNVEVFDNHIYYLCATNFVDYIEGRSDQYEMALYRADFDGNNVTEVVTGIQGVYELYSCEGFIVIYSPNIDRVEETTWEDAFHVFEPDGNLDALKEAPLSLLSEENLFEIQNASAPQKQVRIMGDRLGQPTERPYFTGIKANDAYYCFDEQFGKQELYQISFSEDKEPVKINLTDEVSQGFKNHTLSPDSLVNYDANWLYFADDSSIFRVRKDGSEYERLAENVNVSNTYFYIVDVIDNLMIYRDKGDEFNVITIGSTEKPIRLE